MIFGIPKDSLLDGLAKTVPITEKKSTLPILSHVLIDAKDSRLILTATDLEVGLKISYDCDVKDPGLVAVPSKKIFEIVRELGAGTVSVELLDTGRLKVVSGESKFELAGMDPSDYPAWASLEDVEKVSVPAEKLVYMIDKTMFASLVDESRFNLNGILFEQNEDKTRMVATDGHRLAMIDGDVGLTLSSKVLIPRKNLMEVRRILEGVSGEVSLGFEPKNVVIETDRFTMTARLIDGDYPDYRKVIPEAGESKVVVDRLQFVQMLKRVSVLTSEMNKGIDMEVRPGQIELRATHPDLGTAKDILEVDYQGEEFGTIVNPAYLIEALGVVETDTISLEYRNEKSPLVITPVPAKGYFNLVMPMRK